TGRARTPGGTGQQLMAATVLGAAATTRPTKRLPLVRGRLFGRSAGRTGDATAGRPAASLPS
ncbi:hypothetical protein ACFVW5_31965, partial [Streptomyces sp. NPDC058232]|uniref:hypothetical protein n=1 Tax=Streptomyces sp. NPDC058232 TaxID=3346393 RepID=UPI0036EC89BD